MIQPLWLSYYISMLGYGAITSFIDGYWWIYLWAVNPHALGHWNPRPPQSTTRVAESRHRSITWSCAPFATWLGVSLWGPQSFCMFLLGSDKHRDEKPGSHVHHDVWNPAEEPGQWPHFLVKVTFFHPKILNVFWLLPLLPKLSLQLSWVELLLWIAIFRCCFSPMNFSWFHPKAFFLDRFDALKAAVTLCHCWDSPLTGANRNGDGDPKKIYRKPWP